MGLIVAKVLIAGIPLAVAAAVLGSLIQWRRMSFVGDGLAHSSLLGIACALVLGVSHQVGILLIASLMAAFLLLLARSGNINRDAVLAVGAHTALAGGIFFLYLLGNRVDWESVLFGNILSLTRFEAGLVATMSLLICGVLWRLWNVLVLMAISGEIALTEHRGANRIEIVFMMLVCLYIAVAVQAVGVMLLSSLMIIPAAAARPLARSPLMMALYGALIGILCIVGGTSFTFSIDVPMAPASVLVGSIFFALIWLGSYLRSRKSS